MTSLDICIVTAVVIGLITLFIYCNSADNSRENTSLQCPKCGDIGDNRRSTLVWNEGSNDVMHERYRVCNKCGYCHNFDRRGTQRFIRVSIPQNPPKE